MTKRWFHSRTLWVNLFAALALFIQDQYGFFIDPSMQAYLLLAVNVFLRTVTKTELSA